MVSNDAQRVDVQPDVLQAAGANAATRHTQMPRYVALRPETESKRIYPREGWPNLASFFSRKKCPSDGSGLPLSNADRATLARALFIGALQRAPCGRSLLPAESHTAPVNPGEGEDSWLLWEGQSSITVTEQQIEPDQSGEAAQAMGVSSSTENHETPNVYDNTIGATSRDTLLGEPSPSTSTNAFNTPKIDINVHRRLPEEHRELNRRLSASHSSHGKSSSSSLVSLAPPAAVEMATHLSTMSSASSGRHSPPERPRRPEPKDLPNLKRPPFPPVPPKASGYVPRPGTTGAFNPFVPSAHAGYEAMPLQKPYAFQPVELAQALGHVVANAEQVMPYAGHPAMAPATNMYPVMQQQPNGSYAFQLFAFHPALHPGASYINIPQHPNARYGASPYANATHVSQQSHETGAAIPQYGEYYCNPTPRLAPPGPEELVAARATMPPPPTPPPTPILPVSPVPAARRSILMSFRRPRTLLRNLAAGSRSSPNLHKQLHQEQGRENWMGEILEVDEISQDRPPSGSSGSSGQTAVSRFSNVSADEPRPILSRSRSSISLARIRSKLFPSWMKDGPPGSSN